MLFAALGKAEPLISTAVCQKFDFDLESRSWSTYISNLKGIGSAMRAVTDGRTDATKYIISLASWSIMKPYIYHILMTVIVKVLDLLLLP